MGFVVAPSLRNRAHQEAMIRNGFRCQLAPSWPKDNHIRMFHLKSDIHRERRDVSLKLENNISST